MPFTQHLGSVLFQPQFTRSFNGSVTKSAVFPRNLASSAGKKLQLRVAVFWASFYEHAAILGQV